MIPKIIHYCWLSEEPYPELVRKCIHSWEDKLGDYEIICWDTSRFDVNTIPYTREAYEAGKYAFVSDYIRLWALYNHGGIYLDSDVEVLRNMDDLLLNKAFVGFEDIDRITAWMLGSEKGNDLFKEFLSEYDNKHFLLSNGKYDYTPNPVPLTRKMVEHGLRLDNSYQELDFITVYPMDYFCPYNPYRASGDCFSDNTYVNHYFSGAWKTKGRRIKSKIKIGMSKAIGKKNTDRITALIKGFRQ